MNETDQKTQWNAWNRQGFIPGSQETEEDFMKRIVFCENLESELVKKVGADLPFEVGDSQSKQILQHSLDETKVIYGMAAAWVPLFFSNYQLAPWHGGCAWIFQFDETVPMAAFLQLRARFRDHVTYLGLYHRDELIAHELSHVGRMMYEEPKFEEILAYRSSKSHLRRWLGPIVQSSKESLFFILALGVYAITDAALLSVYHPMAAQVLLGFKLVLAGLVAYALGRLAWRQSLYRRCVKKLSKLYSHPEHVAYRLRDSEIRQFASSSVEQIREWIDQQESFRWRFLKQVVD